MTDKDSKISAALYHALARLGCSHGKTQLLASGGTSVVYKIEVPEYPSAALKLPGYASRAESEYWLVEQTIRNEALLLKQYACVSIPVLFDFHDDEAWIFREFVEGCTLATLLDSQCPSNATRISLCKSLFHMAHPLFSTFHDSASEQLVLRDIKPANIIVNTSFLHLTFIDVGSARPEGIPVSRPPSPERLGSGRWRFLAPEQLLSPKDIPDRRSDYFSFAVTAVMILIGSAPYTNADPDPKTALASYMREYEHLQSKMLILPFVRQIAPAITFLLTCLHPHVEKRPSSLEVSREYLAS